MKQLTFVDRNLYLHPWNLGSLSVGVALLVMGSYWYQAPDWDIPISLIMACFAYFGAAWSMRVLLLHKLRLVPWALLMTWWTVDGCYAVYWHFTNPNALALMRDVNWPASLALYGMCGLVWNAPNFKFGRKL